ncbi:MAG TPA: TIGR03435 family protein [Candidatus Solibacter sp.]|nr:TIGR03435 family protein [Candidatus Solibacter sp.]
MQYRMCLCVITLAAWAFAQETAKPAFDVVSFKHVGDQRSNTVQTGPGSFLSNIRPFRYTAGTVSCRMSMMSILQEAYQAKQFQIQGPDWMGSEIYEINANMPEATSKETARLMLQKMLADRAGLELRREEKEFQVLLLVAIPGSTKLEEFTPTPTSYGYRIGDGTLEANPAMPLGALADNLSRVAGRPVLDETGKSGYYKVKLQWNAEPPQRSEGGGAMPIGFDRGMLGALPQAGLKLEPAKRKLDYLVIEKLLKEPTEN